VSLNSAWDHAPPGAAARSWAWTALPHGGAVLHCSQAPAWCCWPAGRMGAAPDAGGMGRSCAVAASGAGRTSWSTGATPRSTTSPACRGAS